MTRASSDTSASKRVLGDDVSGDGHHLRMDVHDDAVVPAGRMAHGVGRHDVAVGRNSLPMKRRLHEPALA
jgi:hypothetical protein